MNRLRAEAAGRPGGTRIVRAAESPWRVFAPGVLARVLNGDAERMQTLTLRLIPGARLPAHAHTTAEECFVIDGCILIGNHRLQAGDLHIAARGSRHDAVFSPCGAMLLVRAQTGEWE